MFTRTSVVWAESMVAARSSRGFSQFSSVLASGYSRLRRGMTSEIGAASDLTASGRACGGYVYFARQPGIIYVVRTIFRTADRERGEPGMAEVTFDYQNLVEVEGGLRSDELDEAQPRLREAAEELLESSPGFMRLPKTGEYAEASARVAEEIRGSGATDFIHIGIGGSALGPMALQKALNHLYYNALPREARRGPRIHFAENTDPATLAAILDVADPTGTWVNVVTKSGSTAETMSNFLVIRSFLIDALGSFG